MVTNHRVLIQKWISERLETVERFFTREEDARNFIRNEHREGYTSKIYNRAGELIHSETPDEPTTYA